MTVEKLITGHIDIWSSALQTRSAAGVAVMAKSISMVLETA